MGEITTRAQRGAANRAAWAAEREAARADQAAYVARRRAEREEARRANRAAWWARYGLEAPEAAAARPEPAPAADQGPTAPEPEAIAPEDVAATVPDLMRSASMRSCEEVAEGTWDVRGADGCRYTVQASYQVTMPDGMSYEVPTLGDAGELVDMAVGATCEACEGFEAGRAYTDASGASSPVEVLGVSRDGSRVTYRMAGRRESHTAQVDRSGGAAAFVAGGRSRYAFRVRADRPAE